MPFPVVSICVTSYNHENFVRAAVESARQQTFQNWEMILIDDGSSDGTLAALADLCDERIKIHAFSSNKTRCVALNQCLEKARGRQIAILNSDDLWHPQKLEKQVAVLDSNESIGAVFSWVDGIDDHGNSLGERNIFSFENQKKTEWIKHFLLSGTPFCHTSALVRKSVYTTIGTYDERLAQLLDFEQWMRICEAYEVWIIPEFLTTERRLSDRSNVSGDRPDAYARTNWERTLSFYKALQRNHPELRRALNELASAAGQKEDIPVQQEGESEQQAMATTLLRFPLHEMASNPDNSQALKLAMALYLFQLTPPNLPGHPASEQPKQYLQWIRNLDPLRTIELMSTQAELHQTKRELSEAQSQLAKLHAKTILRLSAPLRRGFWSRILSERSNEIKNSVGP